jgi:hypothetical protein
MHTVDAYAHAATAHLRTPFRREGCVGTGFFLSIYAESILTKREEEESEDDSKQRGRRCVALSSYYRAALTLWRPPYRSADRPDLSPG